MVASKKVINALPIHLMEGVTHVNNNLKLKPVAPHCGAEVEGLDLSQPLHGGVGR
jgi:hypothetical protein